MITDAFMRVADAQGFTTSEVSDSSIDTAPNAPSGQIFGAFQSGKPLFMLVTVTAIGTPGAGTIAFELISSAAAALTTPQVMATTEQIADENLLVGGPPFVLVASPDVGDAQGQWLRYIGCNFNVGTTLPASFTFTVDFVESYQDFDKHYQSGFTFP